MATRSPTCPPIPIRNEFRYELGSRPPLVEREAQGKEEGRYFGRDYVDHRVDDPRLLVRVRPLRITGSIAQEAA